MELMMIENIINVIKENLNINKKTSFLEKIYFNHIREELKIYKEKYGDNSKEFDAKVMEWLNYNQVSSILKKIDKNEYKKYLYEITEENSNKKNITLDFLKKNKKKITDYKNLYSKINKI
jgi:RecG-like helicase